VKFLIHGLEDGSIDLLLALGALLRKQATKAAVAVRFGIVLAELIAGKRVGTLGAHKVIGVPSLIQGLNVLALNDLATLATLGIECAVVVIFTIEAAILLDEGLATQFHIALDTTEMVGMESETLGNHIGRRDRLLARVANSTTGSRSRLSRRADVHIGSAL